MKPKMQKTALTFFLGISASVQVLAQTNDYYVNEEARRTIDRVIAVYGGTERLTNVSRLKAVMRMKMGEKQMTVTLHQTRNKIRREMLAGRRMIQVFDGTNAFVVMNGQRAPAPESMQRDLRDQVGKGIMQASLVATYMGRNSQVRWLDKKMRGGETYFVIQTHDAKNQIVEHYFAPKDYREVIQVTKSKTGDEIQSFVSYRSYGGILYPEKTTIRSADGRFLGEMELVEISDEFNDSVFHAPE